MFSDEIIENNLQRQKEEHNPIHFVPIFFFRFLHHFLIYYFLFIILPAIKFANNL